MTINITHLYYDILNLYGESGNIKAIKKYLEALNIKVNVKLVSINDDINLDDTNLLYLGMGTENNQSICLKHLLKYKKIIKAYIENNGYVLASGNSLELFGLKINNSKALEIFNFTAHETPFRVVDEATFKCSFIDKNIIGFQNQGSVIEDIKDNHLFEVVKGTGSYPKSKFEGYTYKNFYGTYLIGPILVRNPLLLKYLINKLIKEVDENFIIKDVDLSLEENAYNTFINQ